MLRNRFRGGQVTIKLIGVYTQASGGCSRHGGQGVPGRGCSRTKSNECRGSGKKHKLDTKRAIVKY